MRSTVRERTPVAEGRNRWMKTRPSLPARCRQSLLRLIRIASDANLNESRHYTCYDLHVPGTVDGEDVKLQRPTPLKEERRRWLGSFTRSGTLSTWVETTRKRRTSTGLRRARTSTTKESNTSTTKGSNTRVKEASSTK
ncbi:hypothetical protein MRB53_018428 [Persea americana]|uniref:Uncharacterized protein n=1 Tax=Persea americana TaxID=3435 RepID=A0ACC2M800_PERAE|nr:hypothetical protein MRB53_018428 [Persea americana]